ncbi:MAG: glycosyltransferase family 4 protein [Lachnospiraceae bacterium]|nr:glycosyltransferase family 4 protein [Lachnospiraceae bacterium]
MKLVIDCFKLVKGTGKSIGIYNLTKNLVENLAKNHIKEDKIIVLGTKYNREDFNLPGVKFISVKYDPHNKLICILWELFLVSVALKRLRANRVLFPRGFAPLRHTVEEYVIVHDMIPFYYHKNFPGVLNPVENFYIMWRLKASVKICDGVLTDSDASKQEIIRWTKGNADKIHVVYPGQNRIRYESDGTDSGQINYICAVTSRLPHKNAKGIIESYVKYFERSKDPLSLVVIGLENADEYMMPEEVIERITCYKYLKEDTDMYDLIRHSRIFLFLSYIEGFGFPPLEAMQLGVPVICSNVSSVPEVVGEAAVLVDPYDTEQVAEELVRLETDEELRRQYIARGYRNTERFLWEHRIVEYRNILLH